MTERVIDASVLALAVIGRHADAVHVTELSPRSRVTRRI